MEPNLLRSIRGKLSSESFPRAYATESLPLHFTHYPALRDPAILFIIVRDTLHTLTKPAYQRFKKGNNAKNLAFFTASTTFL